MEVQVDKGMKDGQKIVLRGEGDQAVCINFSSFLCLCKNTILLTVFCKFVVNEISAGIEVQGLVDPSTTADACPIYWHLVVKEHVTFSQMT